MVRVVGKEGALEAGGREGGNRSSAMGGSRKISRAWKCVILWRISILGGAFEQGRAKGGRWGVLRGLGNM